MAKPISSANENASAALLVDASAAEGPKGLSISPDGTNHRSRDGAGDVEGDDGSVQVGLARSACTPQQPQDFLIRGQFLREGPAGNERAIQYRTEKYGYFKGYGHPSPGAQPASAFAVDTKFLGLHVKLHQKVVPVLACVEQEILHSCAGHRYQPRALAGIRYRNTYRGGEVTNHAYGIAIDVDPELNPCCGCVRPWRDAPLCKRPATSDYDRMTMPECWVHAFERYGFYWLGHDTLQDTMHFEFLGDPDKIRSDASDENVVRAKASKSRGRGGS